MKTQALQRVLTTLQDKGAIVPGDPLQDPGGFYFWYFLVLKKTGDFHPVLDLRSLNAFLKVIPLSHAKLQGNAKSDFSRRLVYINQPEGCLFSCADCYTLLPVFSFCL